MSHTSVYKTKLKGISEQLLKQAIKSFAGKIGASIVASVKDYYGASTSTAIALVTSSLPNGIGFNVNVQGELSVVGDSYIHQREFDRISNLAQNYIKAVKVATTARVTHPTAQMNIKTTQKQVLLEVTY